MASAPDPARRFRRSRWPDVILVVGVVALGLTGAFALWGEDWFHKDGPRDLPVEKAPASSSGT